MHLARIGGGGGWVFWKTAGGANSEKNRSVGSIIAGQGRMGSGRFPTMSYGGSAEVTGTQVTFLDQTGSKSVKAVIAFTVPVSRILPNIITKMNLPVTSPDGQPMSYALDHKEGGRRLLESNTLPEAGVQNGDHLIVYPEVVAGN
jgi:hypothetical protein